MKRIEIYVPMETKICVGSEGVRKFINEYPTEHQEGIKFDIQKKEEMVLMSGVQFQSVFQVTILKQEWVEDCEEAIKKEESEK